MKHATEHVKRIEVRLTKLTEELKDIRQEDDFNEIHFDRLKEKLHQLEDQLKKLSRMSIESSLFRLLLLLVSFFNMKIGLSLPEKSSST